jgi:hypothetical protein
MTPLYTKLSPSCIQLLSDSGNVIQTDHQTFFFLPYWFEHLKDDEFLMHSLGHLPEELKAVIHEKRGTKAKQTDKDLDAILDKLELGTISASQAFFQIKQLL